MTLLYLDKLNLELIIALTVAHLALIWDNRTFLGQIVYHIFSALRIQINKLAIQIDSSQRHRPNQMVMDMMKPKRPQKRKNSESMENLISLKRYHIDSSAGFPS